MPVKIKCFRCKENHDLDLTAEQVHTTKNNRFVANSKCPVCERKMTSLIKKDEYNNILKPAEIQP